MINMNPRPHPGRRQRSLRRWHEIAAPSLLCVIATLAVRAADEPRPAAAARPATGRETAGTVNVADFSARPSVTAGIQEAIDALPPSGGTVIVPAGVYELLRPITLRSNITLRGDDGTSVICRKHPPR